EIELDALRQMAVERRLVRDNLEEFELEDGRRILVAAEGRLVNLGAAEGHPADVMDMSFTNQALAAEWLVKNRNDLEPRIYTLPEEIDREVASIKLARLGGGLEQLTDEQRAYLASWQEGTSCAARRGPACRWRRVRCGCDLSHVASPGRGAALRALPRRPVAGTRAVPARARGHLARIPASGHSPRPGPPPQVPRGGSGCRRAGRG